MEATLGLKDQIAKILDNKMIVSLLRDKKYVADNGDYVTLEGDLNFSIRMNGDAITLDIHDVRPMVVAKRFFIKIKGRLTSVTIARDKIMLGIEGIGNIPIPLE